MGQEEKTEAEDRWWEVHNIGECRPLYFVSLTSVLLFYEYFMNTICCSDGWGIT